MKKALFSLLAICAGFTVFAQQRIVPGAGHPVPSTSRAHATHATSRDGSVLSKTTGVLPDTLLLYNNFDSLLFQNSVLYSYGVLRPADSGYIFGMNAYGDNEFAEYFFPGYMPDTSVEIIGVFSAWGGSVNPNSTNNITFNIRAIDTNIYQVNNRPNAGLASLPGAVIASSQQVPLTSLNLAPGVATLTFFNTPIAGLQSDFFLSYSVSYNFAAANGDTIGLRSTRNGTGFGPGFYETDGQGDTAFFSQNAVMTNGGGGWLDGFLDLGMDVNLSLLPIYLIDPTTSVKGITKNNLTVLNCAPNPAVNNTNINFSLQQNADVTVQVVDAAGRTMTTIQQPGLGIGAHTINIPTNSWPAGNYVCVTRMGTSAAIATQLTVMK